MVYGFIYGFRASEDARKCANKDLHTKPSSMECVFELFLSGGRLQ